MALKNMNNIRNFSIIAHIDHGKSTLADRMLELTGTVEKRKMKEQVLDEMELERERGITIKMQPVRMVYNPQNKNLKVKGQSSRSETLHFEPYVLNLIDTPGHIDFAYEVSRALSAVEGTVLLVDATQGVEAQTLSTLSVAKRLGLVIIPAISKIDSPLSRTDEVEKEVAKLLGVAETDICRVSGKTGEGVPGLLDAIVERVSPPEASRSEDAQGLVFDFEYSDHRGIIIYTRVFGGSFTKGDQLRFKAASTVFSALEVGIFSPTRVPVDVLEDGTIGYIVTGIKEPGIVSVGDTIVRKDTATQALSGYQEVKPVVWASVFPESQDDFTLLRQSLERLRLVDASLSFEEEKSGTLGRGFRCGFLGMLHLEIITERLHREFGLDLTITTPSVFFVVTEAGTKRTIYNPSQFPDHGTTERIQEPWVTGDIIARPDDTGSVIRLLYEHEAELGESETFGSDRTMLHFLMPLRELYRNFFDDLKSVSSGFASLTYELSDMREADVTRLDVLIAGEPIPALSRVVSRRRVEEEARAVVKRLRNILPRQQFATKIQAQGLGRIIASETLSAFRKDVTKGLYGGDVTRKKKVLERQKKGKKRLKDRGKISIPHDTFIKMLRAED